jgi:hypothetical protein
MHDNHKFRLAGSGRSEVIRGMPTHEFDCDGDPEDDRFRSRFIQRLLFHQYDKRTSDFRRQPIPRVLVQYWDDFNRLPTDVKACLDTWDSLRSQGFERLVFDDQNARSFIEANFGAEAREAFSRCHHAAMRCDYFRLCYIFRKGGFYVDADEVYSGASLEVLLDGHRLKLQPLCYDVPSDTMVPPSEFFVDEADRPERIFYVNNTPLIAPAGHAIVERALVRATTLLLSRSSREDIQSTTGPGNLSASLVAYAMATPTDGHRGYEFIRDWERVARTEWNLSYRKDERNWRLWQCGRREDRNVDEHQ